MSDLDRRTAEQVLYRVAICAFMYCQDKEEREPGYTVEEDLVWCARPLQGRLTGTDLDSFCRVVRSLIADPPPDRRALIQELAELSGGDGRGG